MPRHDENTSALGSDEWLPWERVLRQFEAAWRRQPAPRIEDFVPDDGPLRDAVLRELVHIDLEFRLKAGEAVRVEAYLERFPALARDREAVLGLVAAEHEQRRSREPTLPADEYLQRFPVYADELRACLGAALAPAAPSARGDTWNARPLAGAGGRSPWPALPGYEIVGELGRGGMGVVWKARQVGLQRFVAVKMIQRGPAADAEDLARFRAEAEAVARLQHPNIVQIHEVGEWGGGGPRLPYCVLEYVDGVSLDRYLGGKPQEPRASAALVETLARAMHYAHDKGVIHRDLKPANVLLAACGLAGDAKPQAAFTPKITDFGLAKRLEVESGQTQTGVVMGTPRYMAPEQAAGRSRDVGPAVDVYALGVILYEGLTGRPPFEGGTSLETLEQVRSQEPIPLRTLRPKCPRDLETICLKCLQKEPHKRYASALDLAEDLRRFQAGEPIRARPVGAAERLVRWLRRHPVVAALLALVVLTAAVGFAGILGGWYHAERARQQEALERIAKEEALKEKETALKEKEAALEASDTNLHFQRLALADREWWANQIERAEQVLDQCPAARRQWEWHYLKRLCHKEQFCFREHTGRVHCVAFSPDGTRLASAGQDRFVLVWEARTGQVVFSLRGHTDIVESVTFSPDGRWLASGARDATVRLWDARSGEEHRVLRGHAFPVNRVAFSPDGTRLASAGGTGNRSTGGMKPGEVKLWDVPDGRELFDLPGHTAEATGVAFSPDGKTLVTSCWDFKPRLWSTDTGKPARDIPLTRTAGLRLAWADDGSAVLTSPSAGVIVFPRGAVAGTRLLDAANPHEHAYGLAFSRGGKYLALAGADHLVKVWNVASMEDVCTLRGHHNHVAGVAFDPDGKLLASASSDGTVKVWDLATAQDVHKVQPRRGSVTDLACSPDGKLLALAEDGATLLLWDMAAGALRRRLEGFPGQIWKVAFSPDGQRLASSGSDGTVRLWDVASGQELLKVAGGHESLGYLAFRPDGQALAVGGSAFGGLLGEAAVWDLATGKRLGAVNGLGPVNGVAFSPDGQYLATTGTDRSVRVWDANTYQLVWGMQQHAGDVLAVAYSPDGRLLASADRAGVLILWDAQTGAVVHTLRGHTDMVRFLSFSPDSQRLASCSEDRTVKLWDVTTGREALTLRSHPVPVRGLAFSPDGNRLFAGGTDGIIRTWDGTPLQP